jgi:hypothetical protein
MHEPKDWIALAALCVSMLALLWQGYMFWRNTKLNLFQHRYLIYRAIQDLFETFYFGKLDKAHVMKLRHATEHANFLFSEDLVNHIHSILVAASVLASRYEEQAQDRQRQMQVVDNPDAYSRVQADIDKAQTDIRAFSVRLRVLVENETNAKFAPYFSGFNGMPWYVDAAQSLDRWVDAGDEYLKRRQS